MNKVVKSAVAIALALSLAVAFSSTAAAKVDQVKDYDKYLIDMLKDKNLGIRTSAAQLLGERNCKEAVKPLTRMLVKDREYAARIVAAQALYKIGDEKVVPILKRRAKHDSNKTVRHVLAGIVDRMETTYLAAKE